MTTRAGIQRSSVHVVATALMDAHGRILIAQRPPGSHMAGAWEFPGGKLETGETPLQALERELREELGISIGAGPHRPIRKVKHAYADRDVLLEAWLVREFSGEPCGLEGQELRWCDPEELSGLPLLPADAPIIAVLSLPEKITERSSCQYEIGARVPGKLLGALCEDASAARRAEREGSDFVALTVPLSNVDLSALCGALLIPVFACGIGLRAAWACGASGVANLARG